MHLTNDPQTLGGLAGAKEPSEGNRAYVWAYVATGKLAGQPLVLTYDGDVATNPTAAVPATSTIYQLVVIPLEAGANDFQKCQYQGDAEILVDGTTDVAKDDFLEVLTTATSAVKDATSRSVNSIAIAQEAYTSSTPALVNVYLLGERVLIAAS